MPHWVTKNMNIAFVALFIACLTSRTLRATPTNGLADTVVASMWKSWLFSEYEPKRQQSGQKVVKSIFDTVPTFAPDCGEGYESNASGKCIKIVNIQDDEQQKINLNHLSQKFAYLTSDSEESTKNASSMGERFHIDIPLLKSANEEVEDAVGKPSQTLRRQLIDNDDANTIVHTDLPTHFPQTVNSTQLNSGNIANDTQSTQPSLYKKMRFRNRRRKNKRRQQKNRTTRPRKLNG